MKIIREREGAENLLHLLYWFLSAEGLVEIWGEQGGSFNFFSPQMNLLFQSSLVRFIVKINK